MSIPVRIPDEMLRTIIRSSTDAFVEGLNLMIEGLEADQAEIVVEELIKIMRGRVEDIKRGGGLQ